MIHPNVRSSYALLERGRSLTVVMEKPCCLPPIFNSKNGGEFTRFLSSIAQVFRQRLFSAIVGSMSEKLVAFFWVLISHFFQNPTSTS
jgi:hypothetical protein